MQLRTLGHTREVYLKWHLLAFPHSQSRHLPNTKTALLSQANDITQHDAKRTSIVCQKEGYAIRADSNKTIEAPQITWTSETGVSQTTELLNPHGKTITSPNTQLHHRIQH